MAFTPTGRSVEAFRLPDTALLTLAGLAEYGGRDKARVQLFTGGGDGFGGAFDFGRDENVHGGLGGQRCRIRLAQLAGKALVLLCGRSHLLLENGVFLFGRVQ